VGYCGQDGICGCISDSNLCYPSGQGGCCNGQPCNDQGYCGGTCGAPGAGCGSNVECCQNNGVFACCFSGVSLSTVCTDVTDIDGYVCPGDEPPAGGCPAGQTACGSTCADLNSHAGHCGACFASCPLGGICRGGVCGVACTDGRTDCGGACVDLANDEFNCGACFNPCPLGGYCSDGVCGGLVCQDPLVDCYGRCVDLDFDWQNCGACGQGCFEGAECVYGECFDRP
jgi:hypothetical protein